MYTRKINYTKQTPSEVRILRTHGYRINLSQKLGQGGYAKVYYTDFSSNTRPEKLKLACKLIDTTIISAKYVTKCLPQELKIISQLNHPHIIPIHSIFRWKSKFYIFMRYAENGDLLEYIIHYGPVKEAMAKIWLRQICLAVQYLHMLEIAHRDLKCDNILITQNNNVKLTDFGFSRSVIDRNNRAILSDTYCGSMSYCSPQILLGKPYSPKASDMWSLGCVLYVMLNKAPPFDTSNIKTMIENQLTQKIRFRSLYASRYGKEVRHLVKHLLEPSEQLRFKIENVLGFSWISKDPQLNVLSKWEFKALVEAVDLAKSIGLTLDDKSERYDTSFTTRKQSLVNYFKEYDEGFDLNIINSIVNNPRQLSSKAMV